MMTHGLFKTHAFVSRNVKRAGAILVRVFAEQPLGILPVLCPRCEIRIARCVCAEERRLTSLRTEIHD